jgi:threonine/homoserine/homoserine lactone efflux protein
MAWALLGSGARRLLRSPSRVRAFNIAMGLPC